MKFLQANLVTALLAATTLAAPSAAARFKHLREREGDLKKFEKSTSMDELLKGVRKLADADGFDFANFANGDVASMMEEFKGSIPDIDITSIDVSSMMAGLKDSMPDIAFHHKGSSSSSNDEDVDPSQCYFGLDYMVKKYPDFPNSPFNPDPNVTCCAMPIFYYNIALLFFADFFGDFDDAFIFISFMLATGCSITRPDCYSTGTQMTFWQLQSRQPGSGDDVTDYPVCEGAVISPGEFFTGATQDDTNFVEFVLGFEDSPVVVSIPGLHLHCPSGDCTFNGGQFQIASFAELPFGPVFDISGLTIEGFTFTGNMTSLPNVFDQNKYSIFLEAPGTNVLIENNVFRDIINPIGDGDDCNVYREYTAVRSQGPTGSDRALQVTIENNVFENIDVGSYPIYANNPKDCDLCFEETNMRYAKQASFIVNRGQEVNLVGNVIKKVLAGELYFGFPSNRDCEENCYRATISGNTFYKNVVNSLVTLIKPEYADVSFDNNQGECKQSYTGGMYCPVRRRVKDDFFELTGAIKEFEDQMSPLENCDGTKFCISENRASMLSRVDQNVCGEW